MDADRVNRWLTLGANVGVLTGLALLLVELDQSRDATRADTRQNISQEITGLLTQIALDEDMADLRYRADSGAELTGLELYRYQLLQRGLFRYWENVHYQYRLGLYDESEFSAHKRVWARYVNSSARLPNYWCSIRDLVSNDFANEMDSAIGNLSCSQGGNLGIE